MASWVHCATGCDTQSGAPEVGRSDCLKHVEPVWIIDGPLL